jgi:hypothetical protein
VDGEPTRGDLTVELTSNDQNMSQTDITGRLLGKVLSQVGGKAFSLVPADRQRRGARHVRR